MRTALKVARIRHLGDIDRRIAAFKGCAVPPRLTAERKEVAEAVATDVTPAAHKVLRNLEDGLNATANLAPGQAQHIGMILNGLRRRALLDSDQRLTPLARVYLGFYEN